MPMNTAQSQPGLSMPDVVRQCGTEAQCEATLERTYWPEDFRWQHCGRAAHCVLQIGVRKTFQSNACREQTSLVSGTLFHNTRLVLTVWLLAMYLIVLTKPGLSALALKRCSEISYPHRLTGAPPAHAGDGRARGRLRPHWKGRGGRCLSRCRTQRHHRRASLRERFAAHGRSVSGSRRPPVACQVGPAAGIHVQGNCHLSPRSQVVSGGQAHFARISEAGSKHLPIVVGERKPKDLLDFL